MPVILGTEGQDYLTGTAEDDVLSAGGGDDYLRGGGGDDSIDGGTGSDMLLVRRDLQGAVVDLGAGTAVGEGTDRLSGIEKVEGSDGDDVLIGNAEGNDLYGVGGADRISGGGGDDYLEGGYPDPADSGDRLDGGDGDDTIVIGLDDFAAGGDGFDTLQIVVHGLEQGVVIDLSAMWGGGAAAVGTGTVAGFERVSYIHGTRAADVITVGTGGTGHANTLIVGGGGNDRLTGGQNAETLSGGEADDVLFGMGGDDFLTGAEGTDRLEGGEGDDTLIGGEAADVLVGGPGNDTYLYVNGISAAGDRFIEDPDDPGFDLIEYHPYLAPIEDTAFAGVRDIEGARLLGAGDLPGAEFLLGAEFQASGIGTVIASGDIDASRMSSGIEFVVTRHNSRPLSVTAGSGDDSFRFGEYTLPAAYDYVLSAGEGFDTLYLDSPISAGWWGAEVLLSGFEAVVIASDAERASEATAMSLSSPLRHYAVAPTDATMEAGTLFMVDAVQLGAGGAREILVVDGSQLTGGRAVRVRGGGGADVISGSRGNDVLGGGGGNDSMMGGAGSDALNGGAGNDRLDGGADADTLAGGAGADTYIVGDTKDLVVELPGGGSDTVQSAVTYTLGGQLENLRLTGSAAIGGSGNSLANSIVGNGAANALNGGDGNDRLDGGAGTDSLAGGLGHDVYVVDNPGDTVSENGSSGTDTVLSSVDFRLPTHVEKLILTGTAGRTGRGNSGDNVITGNSGANTINGSGGNDIIDGGAGNDLIYGSGGNDSLKGGHGLDRFLFNSAPGSGNADKILDFYAPSDTICLDRTFFKAGPNGTLDAAAFRRGAAAGDSSDRIVYDQATGKIFYDADGTGSTPQLLFATVTPGTALTGADFLVYG